MMPPETDKPDVDEIVTPEAKPDFPSTSDVPGTMWTRRRIVTMGVSLSAGLIAALWSPLLHGLFSRLASGFKKHKYYRTKKSPPLFAAVGLKEGFYARKYVAALAERNGKTAIRKNVIHYVDSKGRIPFIRYIKVGNLRPADQAELTLGEVNLSEHKPSVPSPHVSLFRGSAIFEMAALRQIENRNYLQACELLTKAIEHDLALKLKLKGGPSLRLFDLLAIVAVRGSQQEPFNWLLRVAEDSKKLIEEQSVGFPATREKHKDRKLKRGVPLTPDELQSIRQKRQKALDARLQKWHSEHWQNKMKDYKQPVAWKVPTPVETNNGKSSAVTFLI